MHQNRATEMVLYETSVPGWQGQFGDKSILDHANHYLHCRTHHPHEYVDPKVVFYFCQGITPPLQDALVHLGVTVKGTLQPICEDIKAKLRGLCPEVTPQEKCDSDGYCDTTTKGIICEPSQLPDDGKAATVVLPGDQDEVLSFQAEQERKESVLPALHKFIQGKELLISETALKDFQTILSTVGGDREKERAHELLKHVTVVPDSPSPEPSC
ncbi:hypothetical protein LSAT2_008345 [Lamellibrachia satsuma]|nr:hypothetical protein LSAT2_008345 [Lamellibrachia satsuma]